MRHCNNRAEIVQRYFRRWRARYLRFVRRNTMLQEIGFPITKLTLPAVAAA
jgi:hypothetical protein